MTHFMKPHYFEKTQRDAVADALQQLKIGDPEGRRIFIIALGYELAEYEEEEDSATSESAAVAHTFSAIRKTADSLSQLLSELSAEATEHLTSELSSSDTYSRGYAEPYLNSLQDEINRLAFACRSIEEESSADKETPSESKNRLIANIAEAYSECFEADPLQGNGDIFIRLLKRISTISQLNMTINAANLNTLLTG